MKSSSERIEDFLKGTSNTFFPYVWNWDFHRESKVIWENPNAKAIIPSDLKLLSNRTSVLDLDQNFFCALVGIAGSGKSIFVRRIAFEWHQTGNPVIFIDPTNSSIDTPALDGMMNEIRETYMKRVKEAGVANPKLLKWLLIADGCAPIIGQIKILRDHLLSTGKPGDIILVSRESEAPLEKIRNYGLDAIYKLSDTIHEEDRDSFLQQYKRFGVIDEDIFNQNIRDPEVNFSFFGLIYSTVHSSRKTIDRLLKEEYDKLDEESKKTYQTVSLIQAYQLDPLVTLVTKSQSIDPNWLGPQLVAGSLSGIVRPANYGRSLFTVQRIVAESIAGAIFRTSDERKLALGGIIGAVTCGEESEMRLLENLLNFRIDLDIGPRLTPDHKIDLYGQAVGVVKSKPLLIHLGRLQTNAHRFEDARKTLREAYGAYVAGFDEREEHVRDAEGRLEHAIAEDEMTKGKNCRKDVAWEHLEEAEKKFNEAKIDPRLTPHPYTGLARTYLTKARLVLEESLQWDLILAAAQECNFLDRSVGESPDSYVVKKEVGNLLDNLGFDERHIERMPSPTGKANGYAYLAEIRVAHEKDKEALEFVEKGLKFDGMSIWLMRLRIYLLRRLDPSDHATIRSTLDDYAAIKRTKYDVELSFELAKETYMEGKVREARLLFKELGRRAENYPRKLIPREQEDRWIEAGTAKRLTGTIVKLPTSELYGRIQTSFPQPHGDTLVVRKPDLQYANPRVGDRVNFEIVFNMLGPEVSRVRRL
jgi:tetratricopeptide (TPR) repeat protein